MDYSVIIVKCKDLSEVRALSSRNNIEPLLVIFPLMFNSLLIRKISMRTETDNKSMISRNKVKGSKSIKVFINATCYIVLYHNTTYGKIALYFKEEKTLQKKERKRVRNEEETLYFTFCTLIIG